MTPDLVFDVTRAASPVARLPLSAVHDPLTVTHAADRIARYRERMLGGDRFPPISVIRLFGRYLVADGHKRLAAFRTVGADEIVVEVWPLSRWMGDQYAQALANASKNRRIIALSVTRPREAGRMAATTVLHWKRVAVSLSRTFGRRFRWDRPEGLSSRSGRPSGLPSSAGLKPRRYEE